MRKSNLFIRQAFASVLIFLLSACAEEPLGGNDKPEGGYTVTLRLSASMTPIPETKAIARSGSEAEAAGFYVERVSSDADQAATTPGIKIDPKPVREDSSDVSFVTKSLATKAPGVLKNAYGLLFMSDGRFNGRAQIGTYTVNAAQDITVTNVVDPTASGCRLVIIANNNAAATSYASSAGTGDFARFSGTYAEFQKLTITNAVNQDIDVPYAGSATVNLSLGEIAATADISLSWTLAKITLNNHTFAITGGPARSSITLYNAGVGHFAPATGNGYEGTGSTQTIDVVASTPGSNANSVTWYVGENIQPAGSSIQTPADRNSSKAPEKACYIRVASATSTLNNAISAIGEECISRIGSFTYDYYLGRSSNVTDFALRRHTVYQFNTEISGTLAEQEEIAAEDGRVTLTKTGGESAGLAIGPFGGASGYTTGTGTPPTITGFYSKLLLLEPNVTRTTAADNITKQWSANITTQHQTETRKYWDHTYTSAHIETGAGFAYDYCYNLTLGGVDKGTWYLPTHAQLLAMWSVWRGLQKNSSFANYSAFDAYDYWSSTENIANYAWHVNFTNGYGYYGSKPLSFMVRCVRDAESSQSAPVVSTSTGYPVIDLSALNPLGCVLSSSEAVARRAEMYASGVTPSNDALLSVGLNVSGHNGTWNANMSAKYQVMRANHTVGATDFTAAWNACKAYNGNGDGGGAGTWRLPTQRELYMIWILHPQLIGKAGFTAFDATEYRSATEYTATSAWYMRFSDGYPDYSSKTTPRFIRCVRDIM